MRGSLKRLGKNKWRLVYDLPPIMGEDGKLIFINTQIMPPKSIK